MRVLAAQDSAEQDVGMAAVALSLMLPGLVWMFSVVGFHPPDSAGLLAARTACLCWEHDAGHQGWRGGGVGCCN